jgi:serine/threonine protein phosphatase PrpC
MNIECAGNQILGKRECQEDSFFFKNIEGTGEPAGQKYLAIVADGIGGHGGGDVASQLAVQTFKDHFVRNFRDGADTGLFKLLGGFGKYFSVTATDDVSAWISQVNENTSYVTSNALESDASQLLCDALAAANRRLASEKAENPHLAEMGCTLIAVLVDQGRLWWVSVGDSHLYLLRDGKLEKKNALHSFGAMAEKMVANGQSLEGQDVKAFSKLLVSAVMGNNIPFIDSPKEALELLPGDVVILASDGLNALSDGKLVYFAGGSESATDCVDSLLTSVEAANRKDQDNTTVVAFRCTA